LIQTSDQVDFFHPNLIELRDKNQLQTLSTSFCSKCIVQEQSNKKSMRLGYLETHGEETYDPSIQYLDVNIDYTCNLACVTCGPGASTTWRNELGIKGVDVRPNIDNFIKTKLQTLDLSKLQELRMWGGEPFLTLTHKQILQHLVDHTDVSQIRLMYNTNGTQRIDQSTRELIEKFKFARISFSIDGIGNQFEYLRYPAKWNEVEENLFWWQKNLPHNCMLSLTVTASILNVLNLDSVYNWHKENFSKSVFGDPIEIYTHQAFGIYGLESMPDAMIKHFKSQSNYCQPWIQQLKILGTQQYNLKKVQEELQKNDQRRNLNLAEVFPEIAKFIQYQK
jgi:MoaA/NifB/PqqE/SkfB family radical SAM enzyme